MLSWSPWDLSWSFHQPLSWILSPPWCSPGLFPLGSMGGKSNEAEESSHSVKLFYDLLKCKNKCYKVTNYNIIGCLTSRMDAACNRGRVSPTHGKGRTRSSDWRISSSIGEVFRRCFSLWILHIHKDYSQYIFYTVYGLFLLHLFGNINTWLLCKFVFYGISMTIEMRT